MRTKTGQPQPVTTDAHFGGCPVCGKNNGYLNIHRAHWFYCKKHRTKWEAGWNLFSTWRFESEDDWKSNFAYLARFKQVEPLLPIG